MFFGDVRGALVAANAKTGALLWHFNTGQNFKAGPMTYTSDVIQYIGVAAVSTILPFRMR